MNLDPFEVKNLVVELCEPSDLDAVMDIENNSFTLPWTRKSYEEALVVDTVRMWIARVSNEIVGYALVQLVENEMELHTFAVKEHWRRMGVGTSILKSIFDEAKKIGVQNVFLLVRTTNVAARTLYQKLGFKMVGIRKNYYVDTGEDALVMMLAIV